MAQFHNYIEICVAIGLHATAKNPITGPSLEQLYELPLRKTELLIRKLVRANIIQSVRGHYGGYFIAQPEKISLAALYDVYCSNTPQPKMIFDKLSHPIENLLLGHRKEYHQYLNDMTLGDILQQYDRNDLPKRELSHFVYHI